MTTTKGRIGLQESIDAVRQEIMQSIAASQGEELRFEVGQITMEFHVEVERSIDGKGGIKFWIFDIGGSGGAKDKSVHKITIPLIPVTSNRKPILTGGTKVPD